MEKSKEPIRLRQRETPNGLKSDELMVEILIDMASNLYKPHATYHAQEQGVQFFCRVESV